MFSLVSCFIALFIIYWRAYTEPFSIRFISRRSSFVLAARKARHFFAHPDYRVPYIYIFFILSRLFPHFYSTLLFPPLFCPLSVLGRTLELPRSFEGILGIHAQSNIRPPVYIRFYLLQSVLGNHLLLSINYVSILFHRPRHGNLLIFILSLF